MTDSSNIRMLLTGKMGSGKGYAALYLASAYKATRWSRTELMKRVSHAVAHHQGDLDELLSRLFDSADERDHVREALFSYILTYADEPGKPRKLYQDTTEICQEFDPLCFERELYERIEGASGHAQAFSLVDDVRVRPAFDYFKGKGYITVRIDAPEEIRRSRMLARDGYLPDDRTFNHRSEVDLDGVPHDFVVTNDSDDVRTFYAQLDDLMSTVTKRG